MQAADANLWWLSWLALPVPAGVAAAALAVPQQASAIVIPSQESYGGLGRNTGSAGSSPKSPTRASMEGCECTP